ncbi:VOC family protein [Sphingomonas ginkgonis]|uniref:VOC family protein n=1 Tax=Sphingomonas ginkgonis TaxID=2315330 RepID=A0A429V7G2_9SPHN|nr:VOC family protein [Sphingomonas ginkgonis]RST29883.1 VOC family protein [Sphingomonas ginkgonis]
MGNPHGSFIWYELMSPDPEGAKTFYDAVVGWDIEPKPAGELDYRMIRRGDGGNAGGILKLDQAMQDQGAKPTWLGYVGVDDVDKFVEAATARGAHTIMPPWSVEGIGRMALIADPQGAVLYVMKPTPPGGDPDATSDVFSVDAKGRVNWNELSTSDPQAALDFYGPLLGWVNHDTMPMGELGGYHFLDHHDLRFGATCGTMGGQPPAWRYYIGVDSIERAKAAVEAQGGTPTMGPHEVPGGSWILLGRDPQGAEFALVGGK